jgi:outer membrane protein insertion porin family
MVAVDHRRYFWREKFARPLPGGRGSLIFLMLCWLFAPPLVHSQTGIDPEFEGKPITRIVFEPAAQPYSREYLLDLLPVKMGAVFHASELPRTIQALFSTGRYADIAVDGSALDQGVLLRFVTKRAYFVGRVLISGVKEPPNRGQLLSATKLVLGQPFEEQEQSRAIEALRVLLRGNGFYNASVNARTTYDDRYEQANVSFEVETGSRALFEPPVIQGRPERPIDSIVKSAKWKRLHGLLGWQPVTESRVQQGLDNIRRYYEKEDLLLARVNLRQLEYNPATNTVKPVIFINGGPHVQIRTEGARLGRGKLRQLVPVYQERTVDEDLILEGEKNILQYLQAEGYFEAEVSHSDHSEPDVRVITSRNKPSGSGST